MNKEKIHFFIDLEGTVISDFWENKLLASKIIEIISKIESLANGEDAEFSIFSLAIFSEKDIETFKNRILPQLRMFPAFAQVDFKVLNMIDVVSEIYNKNNIKIMPTEKIESTINDVFPIRTKEMLFTEHIEGKDGVFVLFDDMVEDKTIISRTYTAHLFKI